MNKTNSESGEPKPRPLGADGLDQERQPTGLLACPFAHIVEMPYRPPYLTNEMSEDSNWCVYCPMCSAATGYHDFPETATRYWNTRTEVKADQPAWQPIETAPKDRGEIWAWPVFGGIDKVHWYQDSRTSTWIAGSFHVHPTHWTLLTPPTEQPSTSDVLGNPDRGMSSRNLPESKCKHCKQPIRRPEGEPWIHVNSGLWTCRKGDTYINSAEPVPPTQATKSSEASCSPNDPPASSCPHNPYGFCRSHGHVNSSHRCRDFDGSLPESESVSESEIAELRQRELGPTCAHCNERRILGGESAWGVCALCWNRQLEVIGSLRKQLAAAETRVKEWKSELHERVKTLRSLTVESGNDKDRAYIDGSIAALSNLADDMDAQPTSESGE